LSFTSGTSMNMIPQVCFIEYVSLNMWTTENVIWHFLSHIQYCHKGKINTIDILK
jgi:hypothetical protein